MNSLNDMSQIQGCVDSHLWTGVFMDWCAKYSVYCRLLYPRETCTDGRTDVHSDQMVQELIMDDVGVVCDL